MKNQSGNGKYMKSFLQTKIAMLLLGLAMCLSLALGITLASPTATASAEEGGTPPTIIRTGGIDVQVEFNLANLPYAIVGKEYKAPDGSNYKVEATGTQPITFEANYGSEYAPMPPGLTLTDTGEITGTPTVAGVYQRISITANNAYGSHNVMALMYVYGDTYKPTINSPAAGALPTGYVNSAYSQYIGVTSKTAEEATLTVMRGSLPDGLSLRRRGSYDYIEGTPTTKGTFTFTLRLENPVGFDEKEYTIVINEDIERANIVRYPSDSDYAIKGKYYEFQCEATGTNTAVNPILFFVKDASGNDTPNAKGEYDLGNGLSLTKDGKIYGTPTTKDQVSFTLYVKNKNEYGNYLEDSQYCYIIIKENGAVISITISPESTSVPKGGKRQFTAEVERVGDLVMPLTWMVWGRTSSDTTIDKNGLLTVGLDETAETLTVLADSHDGMRASVTVAVVDHIHRTALVPAKDKTCTQDGNIEHYVCTICGAFFEDEGATILLTEDDVVIPAGHEYGELVAKKEPTCSAAGMRAHYKCSGCNQYFDEHKAETTAEALTIAIDPDAHAFGEWTEEVPADCTHTGTKAHKDCTLCKKHFDEGGAEITDLTIATNDKHDWGAWVSNGDGTHTRTCKRDSGHKENGTCSGGTATCTTKAVCDVCKTTYGGTAPHNTTQYGGKDSSGHWDKCSTCDDKINFEEHTPDREKADETNPVKCSKCDFVITPAGHYEHTADSEWHNSADGTYHYHKCTHSGCSVILDKADHSGGTATCENKAVCSVCGLEYGDKLGHDWGEVKYTWTSDNTCKAERVCKHDSAHTESETVTATGTTIKAATCKEKGKMKYTATFVNTAFAAQEKEVDIDFAPHTYGEWKDEIPATTEDFGTKGHKDCTVCGKHFDKNGNEITELRIAKIGTHNVIVNGESKFYAHGESVTVTADDPEEGKIFKGWKDMDGNIVSTEKVYTFTVSGEVSLTAVYEDKPTGGETGGETEGGTDGETGGEITPEPDKGGLSTGAIVGIAVGSVAVAGLGGFAIFWFAVKKKTFADLIAVFRKKK